MRNRSKNGRFDFDPGAIFFGARARSYRTRLDIVPNEPSAEPAWRDLRHHSEPTTRQRTRHRGKVDVVGNTQVLEALSNAPLALTRLPVQLLRSERLHEGIRALVGGIELGNQTNAPGGRFSVSVHGRLFPFLFPFPF